MEGLLLFLGGLIVVVIIIWQSGKRAGLSEARRDASRKEGVAYREHAREVESLERERKDARLELSAVESVLKKVNGELDALRGAIPWLIGLSNSKPNWMES